MKTKDLFEMFGFADGSEIFSVRCHRIGAGLKSFVEGEERPRSARPS
jgi:hypothetical protein